MIREQFITIYLKQFIKPYNMFFFNIYPFHLSGQFTRGVIKTISTGLSRPFSQLMAGVRDIGSLDSDRGFINSLASGVTSVANVANSMVDVFKDRVEAIYPGKVFFYYIS